MRQINDSSDGVYYYVCNRDGEMIYHPRQSEMSRGLFAEDSSAAAGYEDGVYEMPSGGSRAGFVGSYLHIPAGS